MENGEIHVEGRFSGLTMNDPVSVNGNDGLFQVMKAVEAAEANIRQQVEENNRLRSELQERNEELEKYRLDELNYQSPRSRDQWVDNGNGPHRTDQVVLGLGNHVGGIGNMTINHAYDLADKVYNRKDQAQSDIGPAINNRPRNFFDDGNANGSVNVTQDGWDAPESLQFTQFASPSISSFSPQRSTLGKDPASLFKISEGGLIAMSEVNNPNHAKQDLVVKVREHEEEILQLKKHLAEYTVKEAQICQEKYTLEKRISYMRVAFDQQQQDLVDSASKAISYRQEIMEENVRLTYALQAAQQEGSAFVSSLMPLLAEYSLQPPVVDAQSIVSNVKVLFRHLQEQLLVTQGKLKESQYQLAPWRSDANPSNYSQSPSYPVEIKDGLELVAQPAYPNGKIISSDPQTTNGDLLGRPQSGLNDDYLEHDELGNHTQLASRHISYREASTRLVVRQAESQSARNNGENVGKKVTFGDLVRNRENDDPDHKGQYSDREPSANWSSKASTYATNPGDPNMSYSHLPSVLEEPSSSFSEAADDDPLPAIEGLQISGEAYPGKQLRASGYSINGTTSCNFEWVRHLEDGSFNYIEGAKQPNYIVTADDIDAYLAIEVQPLDDRKRKGELVKVFANEHRKITCDSDMQGCIEKTFYNGHVSYKLLLSTGFLDIWEPATLTIKRDGYSIKGTGPTPVSVGEKFMPTTIVTVSQESPTEFAIGDTQQSAECHVILKVDDNTRDISGFRDTIVLTLRLFIMKAVERKKLKKRGLFFNK